MKANIMGPQLSTSLTREARERPDFVDQHSPEGLRVVQITTSADHASSHIYPEARVFSPDARRFVYQRFHNPEQRGGLGREREYVLCDLADGCAQIQLTDEPGAVAPSMTPDGRYVVYLVNETQPGSGRLLLERVCLETFRREILMVVDRPPAGQRVVPSRIYVLSTISADGKRLATQGFLGDGETDDAPWGLLVFDLEKMELTVPLEGADFCNMHPQYCWAAEPALQRDLLVQHNHGSATDRQGRKITLVSGEGADVHVIRDDGSEWRDMPWGRDGVEMCQGHQCWRGHRRSAVSSMVSTVSRNCDLIEGLPVACSREEAHQGRTTPGAARWETSRGFQDPRFWHFAFDPTGTRLVSDAFAVQERAARIGPLWIGSLEPEEGAAASLHYLLDPRVSLLPGQRFHPHPFFSPDGKRVFFNSDDLSGVPQIWMAEGFGWPIP